jgi:hypothetical protein
MRRSRLIFGLSLLAALPVLTTTGDSISGVVVDGAGVPLPGRHGNETRRWPW